MSVFATIVVSNKNQADAQALTSLDMFTTEFKKGLMKYWVSSGNFPQDYYDALVDSGLIYAVFIDSTINPKESIATLGITKVITEE
jgi:hypothetical protein